ncbi:MAG: hypothetical protein PHE89_05900 [Alphaproteobacteria bacterium]|nr:hypothetical protein [Alphaproteobacteria bacterium]
MDKDIEKETKETVVEETTKKSENKFLLKNRYEINFDAPIQWLNNNGAKAFEVTDRINTKVPLFALICDNKTTPRFSIIDNYKEIIHENILTLVDNGIANYPSDETQHMVLIYQRPLGGKVIRNAKDYEEFIGNENILRELLLDFVSICESLKNKAITHRSIRIDNLYYKDEERKKIVLGDCLATFPAFYQPLIYESLDSSLAINEGRTTGTTKDDVFAAGVLALCLFLGKEPCGEMTKREITRNRALMGSYQTFVGKEVLSKKASNIFRKMLDDDRSSRWSHVDLYNSLDKHIIAKTTPQGSDVSKKSIIIDGKKLYSPRNVAFALLFHLEEAYNLVKDGKIVEWIKSGLQNEDLYIKINKTVKADIEKENELDILVSKIAIMLDPTLPIFYRGINIFPKALPKALYYTMKNKPQDMFLYHELIATDLIRIWHQEQQFSPTNINVNEIKLFASRNEYGYGIYRVMYELDEDIPCTSPLIGKNYVNSHTRLLKALDDNYNENSTLRLPFDKNIIAYIYANLGKSINKIILNINSKKESEKTAGIIKIYSIMQSKYGPAKLPNLVKWLIKASHPIIESYHNIKYRQVIEKEIAKAAPDGDITVIYDLLDNPSVRQKDNHDYTIAISKINSLTTEKKYLVSNGQKILNDSRNIGKNLASIIGILAMMAAFIFSLINWVKW